MSRVSAILNVSVILIVALIMPNLARHALTDVTMDSRTITPVNVTTNAQISMIVAQIMTLSVNEEEAEVSEKMFFK